MLRFRKEERKTVGRRAPAGNLGIFCVSRIFEVIPRYVRTNITVSPGRAHRKHARKTRLAVLGTRCIPRMLLQVRFSFLLTQDGWNILKMRSARVTLLILCKHLRVSHLEYFFSKISKLFLRKRRNIRTTKCNSCRNVCTYIILQPISRKRKRGRSVFIEMFARALLQSTASSI